MKLVREHINEKFKEKSDPIKDMGIGYLSQLEKRVNGKYDFSKLSLNQILQIGVNHSMKDDDAHYDIIKFCIDNGADLLWKLDNSLHIVQITGVNKNYGKYSDPKISFKTIWPGERRDIKIGDKWSSVKFRQDYRAITEDLFQATTTDRILQLQKYKDAIINSGVKLENSPY